MSEAKILAGEEGQTPAVMLELRARRDLERAEAEERSASEAQARLDSGEILTEHAREILRERVAMATAEAARRRRLHAAGLQAVEALEPPARSKR